MNQEPYSEARVDEHRDHTDASTDTNEQIDPSEKVNAAQSTKDFKVALDLRGFTPEELSVKIVGNTLRVEAKHESEADGSHFLKSYNREILLPEDVDLDALKSSLNADGLLNLTAPRRRVEERAIPIDVAREEPFQKTQDIK